MSFRGLGTFSGNIKYLGKPFYERDLDKNDLKYFVNLLDDKQFLGLATWRYQWMVFSQKEFHTAAKQSQKILDLVRSELKS